jgi:hypothetical protein
MPNTTIKANKTNRIEQLTVYEYLLEKVKQYDGLTLEDIQIYEEQIINE